MKADADDAATTSFDKEFQTLTTHSVFLRQWHRDVSQCDEVNMCCAVVSDSQNVSSFTINESAHYNNTTVNCKILSQNVVTFLKSKLAVSPTKSLYEMSEMTSNASSVF